jgi:hypothetical protein
MLTWNQYCSESPLKILFQQHRSKAVRLRSSASFPVCPQQKPGERVKTNRRDALSLVKQLRAGDLTAVWVPDPRHEAMRDLTRAREAAVEDLRCKRQQVSAFLLRQGLHYTGKRTWTNTGAGWRARSLHTQSSASPSRRCCWRCARRKSASSGWSWRSGWQPRIGRWPRS